MALECSCSLPLATSRAPTESLESKVSLASLRYSTTLSNKTWSSWSSLSLLYLLFPSRLLYLWMMSFIPSTERPG